jgi:uncharacterized protein
VRFKHFLAGSLAQNFYVLLACIFLILPAFAEQDSASGLQIVPKLTSLVMDLTGTLSTETIAQLTTQALALQQQKGSQLQILIVPTTQPEDVEQYALRVFNTWHLGRKSVDDGVLLLLAKDDRRMRIEVGYGLEGAIPDITAAHILDDYLTPKLKEDDFDGGILIASQALIKLMNGELLPPPALSSFATCGKLDKTLALVIAFGLAIGAACNIKWFGVKSMLLMGVALPVAAGFYMPNPAVVFAAAALTIASLPLGYFAAERKPTRYFLVGLAALTAIICAVFWKTQAAPPSLAVIGIVLGAFAFFAIFLSIPVMFSVDLWRKKRQVFYVRLATLLAIIAAAIAIVYSIYVSANGDKAPVNVAAIIAGGCLYFVWIFCMTDFVAQKSSGGGRSSGSSRSNDDNDDSSSSSSSSSSSYSGGGGSSGGGGASGSW